jgi:hypothetical protein
MKKRNLLVCAGGLLGLILAVPISTLPQATTNPGQQAPAKKGGERHPEIHEAQRQLQHARETLQHDAARDFQGHRAKAVEHINQALQELNLALQADKN